MVESLTLLFIIWGLYINQNNLKNKTFEIKNNFIENEKIENFFATKYNVDLEKVVTSPKISDIEKKYVAHAGGMLDNKTYLNCYEAIENSYKNGFRLIELDIEMTSDEVPVMLHSWDGFVTAFFDVESDKIYSYEEFKKFKMINSWNQLSLDEVINLMDSEFLDMYLVTDTKNDNKKLLELISKKYNYMMHRIIPQVYSQEEYHYA